MKLRRRICLLATLLVIGMFGTWKGKAFALLGPFQPWMQPTNGLNYPWDIGGPMCISNEYRWNVPVITYGFDKSFIDFFGTNGEAAVESAIQVLNNLPPASQVALENYPYNSQEYNLAALAPGLLDLKSQTLPLLLEQMGLAQPTRYIFVLRQWNPIFDSDIFSDEWPDWVYPDYISQCNYDPQTLEASDYINNTLYDGMVESGGDSHAAAPFAVDPDYYGEYNAVADGFADISADGPGVFYAGLTSDDVGGLRYLLSTNTIAYETLLPGVTGVGKKKHHYINGAWRPGIDKITFVAQPTDSQSGAFLATTNFYTDTYISNGIRKHQQLARVITKPDFLFCAADLTYGWSFALFDRSGTTNWINNASQNGNPTGGGPGVIQPQVKIVFDKLGPVYDTNGSFVDLQMEPQAWASFDGSTNVPVIYPAAQTGTNQMTVRIWFYFGPGNEQSSITWKPSSKSGSRYALQTSANLASWTTLFTVTNNSSVCNYNVAYPSGRSQFYRLVPQ